MTKQSDDSFHHAGPVDSASRPSARQRIAWSVQPLVSEPQDAGGGQGESTPAAHAPDAPELPTAQDLRLSRADIVERAQLVHTVLSAGVPNDVQSAMAGLTWALAMLRGYAATRDAYGTLVQACSDLSIALEFADAPVDEAGRPRSAAL